MKQAKASTPDSEKHPTLDGIRRHLDELKESLRQLKATRNKQPDEYLDKLISNAKEMISYVKSRQKRIESPDPRRKARVLAIAEALHLSLRDHLPRNFSPTLLLAAAESVDERLISARSRDAVNKRHDQKGGSRDKAARIRAEYATGRYPTKDKCAEQAGAKIGMSYTAAKKALRGTKKAAR